MKFAAAKKLSKESCRLNLIVQVTQIHDLDLRVGELPEKDDARHLFEANSKILRHTPDFVSVVEEVVIGFEEMLERRRASVGHLQHTNVTEGCQIFDHRSCTTRTSGNRNIPLALKALSKEMPPGMVLRLRHVLPLRGRGLDHKNGTVGSG